MIIDKIYLKTPQNKENPRQIGKTGIQRGHLNG